ncbi:hypothetical protein BD626DRAFT_491930 [Schizophyllum amplum]|uniref:C2H2-type domain-containing protein n=1 Tax=Schizophyllum amplum TaxID=97359 RepID=A0A550CI37_9AGAR|nr:hypothetical protein BD626DRAFT_491930 [Auriculariopsis ampla]
MSHQCTSCKRTFTSTYALEHHVKDSPAGHPICRTCAQPFRDDRALEQVCTVAAAVLAL